MEPPASGLQDPTRFADAVSSLDDDVWVVSDLSVFLFVAQNVCRLANFGRPETTYDTRPFRRPETAYTTSSRFETDRGKKPVRESDCELPGHKKRLKVPRGNRPTFSQTIRFVGGETLDPPGAMHDNMCIMTYNHPTKLTALLLITMGRAESLDPPFLS